jgi:hypothetical protein
MLGYKKFILIKQKASFLFQVQALKFVGILGLIKRFKKNQAVKCLIGNQK